MKNQVLSILLVAVLSSISLGCSSSSDSCETISCQNGGQFINCQCDCPEGYTGNNCSVEFTPSKVIITKAIVKVFPNTDNGNGWDVGLPNPEDSLADIYITFQDSDLNVIYDSPNYYENALSGQVTFFEFTLTPNIEITDFDNPYLVNIWDYDPSDADDFMTSYGFFAYLTNSGFPETLTVVNQASEILVDLEVSYQW